DHELFFQHARRVAVDEADVVCVIGTPLDFRLSFGRFGADTKLVHIHADATELGRNRAPMRASSATAQRCSASSPTRSRRAATTAAGSQGCATPSMHGGTAIAPRSNRTRRRCITT